MLSTPHFAARQAIVTTRHPQFGELRMQNVAPRLSATPSSVRTRRRRWAEHKRRLVYQGVVGPFGPSSAALARGNGVVLTPSTKRPGSGTGFPSRSIRADQGVELARAWRWRTMVGILLHEAERLGGLGLVLLFM
jgi:hypothetical protein